MTEELDLHVLAKKFEQRLRDSIPACARFNYHPRRFAKMLDDSDAMTVARSLVKSGDLQTGLRTLAKNKRLELSLESIMLEPEFLPLFSRRASDRELLDAAKWRLDEVGRRK